MITHAPLILFALEIFPNLFNLLSDCKSTVLLSTIIIEVVGKDGKFDKVRAVLDTKS